MNQISYQSSEDFQAQLNANYEDIKVLNTTGGGGVIYSGIHKRLKRRVVLKKIRSEHIDTIGSRREMEVLLDLKHTYLPQIFDFWQYENDVYTVMEFIEGKSLKELLDEGVQFTEKQVIRLTRQLAEVLDYLHKSPGHIIHSDIKPANIMLTPSGDICLIDFNVSTLQNGEADETIGYTPGYAPVEQLWSFVRGKQHAQLKMQTSAPVPGDAQTASPAVDADKTYLDPEDVTFLSGGASGSDKTMLDDDRTALDTSMPAPVNTVHTINTVTATSHAEPKRIGRAGSVFSQLEDIADSLEKKYGVMHVDARSDIYSACATMYHLLTGHRPLSAEQKQLPPEKLKPDINDAFADILNHGMQQDPKKRFTSAEQMLSALNKLTKSTKRYKRMRRGQDLAVIFCVMLFAAGAAAFYLGGQDKLTSYIETSISDAKALYAAGQYEDTINTLNASILEKPYVQEDMALGETYYLIGNSFLQLEQYADAANQLRSAVFYRGDQADYYRDYGIALVRSGNIDLADEALHQATVLGISDAGLQLLTGEIAAARGQYEAGITAYETCLGALAAAGSETSDDSMRAHALLGYDSMLAEMAPDDTAQLQKRVSVLEAGLASMTHINYRLPVLEHYAQAAVAYGNAAGDPAYLEKAISAYTEITQSGFATLTEWLNLAVCHQSIGQYQKAKDALLSVETRYSDRYELFMRLAFVEVDLQYEKKADERDYSLFKIYAGKAIHIYRSMPNPPEDPEYEYLIRTAEEVVDKFWLAGL